MVFDLMFKWNTSCHSDEIAFDQTTYWLAKHVAQTKVNAFLPASKTKDTADLSV